MYCIAQLAMEALLLEDSFEDIFSDPALLECADNPDGDSKPQAELEGEDLPLKWSRIQQQ